MSKYVAAILFIVFVSYFGFAGTIKQDISDTYVQVITRDGTNQWISGGSGQVVELFEKQKLILTAHHVIEKALEKTSVFSYNEAGEKKEITKVYKNKLTVGRGNTFYECKVIHYSPYAENNTNVDLALLQPLVDIPFNAAKLFSGKTSDLEAGEDFWYIGTPFGVSGVLERTILSDTNYYYPHFNSNYYLFNGNGTYGNSGGGAFVKRNGEYQLVTLVTLLAQPQNPKSSLCGVPVEVLNKFLNSYKTETLPAPKENQNGHPKKN